jgi:hypothetical protein
MRRMGIEALYPKPNLSRPAAGHQIYPYLLRDVVVSRPNQVWNTDITYIPMRSGFLYLVAILDWFSRFVLSWNLSNTMEVDFCRSALEEALLASRCEIFNSDQGSQFTSSQFLQPLKDQSIRISMDGRGRALDNVFMQSHDYQRSRNNYCPPLRRPGETRRPARACRTRADAEPGADAGTQSSLRLGRRRRYKSETREFLPSCRVECQKGGWSCGLQCCPDLSLCFYSSHLPRSTVVRVG